MEGLRGGGQGLRPAVGVAQSGRPGPPSFPDHQASSQHPSGEGL